MNPAPNKRTSIRKTFVPACPGCGQPIWGTMTLDQTVINDEDPANIILQGSVVGVKVEHNCNPKVTRPRGGGV